MNAYINYDLRITPMGADYHLRADCSLAGQETGLCTMPFSDEEIQMSLWQETLLNPKEMGRQLYDAIFQKNIGIHLRTCLSMAKAQKDNLRIQLHLNESSQLTHLPWEYLYDTARDDFFALSIQTPIVRYLDMPIAESSMKIEAPLHILIMIADPVDVQPRLDVEREWILLRAAFQDLEDAQKIKLHRLPNANKLELQRYLRGNRIDIFHFIGHGYFDEQNGEGNLIFEDGQRQAEPISADSLARLLKDKMPNLVYLNSCDTAQSGPYDPLTGTAQKLVQHGIPAVVAMQTAIQDDKAIQIAHEFYLALTDGYPVDAALVEGRKAVFNNNGLSQWGTPVLFMRAPDGILWDQEKTTEVDNKLSEVSLPPPEKKANFIPSNLTDRSKKSKRYAWGCYAETLGAGLLLSLIAFLIVIYSNFMPPLEKLWERMDISATEPVAALIASPTAHPTSTPTAFSTPTEVSIPVETATSMVEPAATSTATPAPTVIPIAVSTLGAFSCTNVNDIPSLECEALVALYNSTDGTNWNDNSGWLENETACSWYGITCEKGRVFRLELDAPRGDYFGLKGDIPAEIGNLTKLDVLHLAWNELNTVPREIGQLSNLSALHLVGNQITALPAEIDQLSSLRHLSIGVNPLKTIPAEIGQLYRLIELDLRQSQLSTLPPEISNLSKLNELDLSNNEFDEWPAGINNLASLTILSLDNNLLKTLPAEIGGLSSLSELVLSDNFLKTLPTEIGGLSSLNELVLSDNKFSTWPMEINTLSNLTILDLSNNLLNTLPAEVGDLSSLNKLVLNGNFLKTLPTEIGDLSSLNELFLGKNKFSTWPAEINTLSNLELLDLHENLLEEFPVEIVELSNLHVLLAWTNKLRTLPVEIGDLPWLERLYLAGNKLQTVPVEIGNLSTLEILDISWNQLNTLPVSFVKLINVEELKLERNQLVVTDPALLDWMNAKDPDWADNQR